MIPILYEKNETAFTSNGICRLPDIISGTVTEERNGIFIAEFEYPVDGENYAEIQIGRIIFCSCSQGNKQPFEIYEASRPINGRVIFIARHVTYRGNFVPIAPFTLSNTTPAGAMEAMKTHVMSPCTCPFTFESTITSLNNYKQDEPAVLRSRLGGTEGSILDVWGGEYEWGYDFTNQRPLIKLWAHRGANRGVQIKYGKNLTDLQQDESIENMITGVVAFYKNEDTCIYSDVVYANVGGQYTTYPRITTLDVSADYESVPTKAQLNAKAQSYIDSHNIGVPEVNLSISFVNLADTEEYKNIAVLEQVKLCDTVVVEFEKLGVNATAKVIKTVWNILLDKYDSVELGESRTNIATQIIGQDDAIREIKENVPQLVDVQAAINRATALITGATGGYVVIKQDDNTGYPKEILIMDTPDINTATKVWRWNENGLGYSSTGYAGTYALAMTKNGEIVASFITSGEMSGDRITANTMHGDRIIANTLDANAITTGTLSAGQIKTGTLADPNNRNSINMATGAFSLANGAFSYVAGDSFVSLANNLSLKLNGIPLAGEDITASITSEHRFATITYLKVIRMPYIIFVYLTCYIPLLDVGEYEDIIDLPVTANTPDNFTVTFADTTGTNWNVYRGGTGSAIAGWARLYAYHGGGYFSTSFAYPI